MKGLTAAYRDEARRGKTRLYGNSVPVLCALVCALVCTWAALWGRDITPHRAGSRCVERRGAVADGGSEGCNSQGRMVADIS